MTPLTAVTCGMIGCHDEARAVVVLQSGTKVQQCRGCFKFALDHSQIDDWELIHDAL